MRLIFVLLLVLQCSLVEAATYYVGTSGSDANSCATAQSSTAGNRKLTIAAGESCLTTAGDVLIIGNGTYTTGELNFNVSGTSGNPIIVKAENNLQAIVSSTSCNMGISINASYVWFQYIRITNDPSTTCTGGASRTALRAWNQGGNTPKLSGTQSSGYVGFRATGVQIDDMPTLNVGLKTNQDDTIVENSTIHMGLEAFDNKDNIFRNNILYSATTGGQNSAMNGKGGVRNLQMYNNVAHRGRTDQGILCGGSSANIYLWDPSSGYEAYNCVAYNNVIINEGSTTNPELLGFYGCKDCTLMNNIVIGGGGGLFSGVGGVAGYPQPLPDNPRVINNIFDCGGLAAIGGYYGTQSTGTRVTDSNIFYNCTGVPTGTNQLTSNPLFVNRASDWHLQAGSPGIGSGAVVTMAAYPSGTITVNTDFDGVTRGYGGAWDRGIYEFGDLTPPAPPTGISIVRFRRMGSH